MVIERSSVFPRKTDTIRIGQADHLLPPADVERVAPSQLAAFLLGGVMIAGGLMAFLYYDAALPNRTVVAMSSPISGNITTGSITPPAIMAPASNVAIPVRRGPDQPAVEPR